MGRFKCDLEQRYEVYVHGLTSKKLEMFSIRYDRETLSEVATCGTQLTGIHIIPYFSFSTNPNSDEVLASTGCRRNVLEQLNKI